MEKTHALGVVPVAKPGVFPFSDFRRLSNAVIFYLLYIFAWSAIACKVCSRGLDKLADSVLPEDIRF